MDRPIRIMFVCTGNSARSQMTEAFARVLGQGRIEARSAGIEPKGLNPNALRVMEERGIDISGQQSKGLDLTEASEMDYLITVCGSAEERCPVLPAHVARIRWPLEDPAAAPATRSRPGSSISSRHWANPASRDPPPPGIHPEFTALSSARHAEALPFR